MAEMTEEELKEFGMRWEDVGTRRDTRKTCSACLQVHAPIRDMPTSRLLKEYMAIVACLGSYSEDAMPKLPGFHELSEKKKKYADEIDRRIPPRPHVGYEGPLYD